MGSTLDRRQHSRKPPIWLAWAVAAFALFPPNARAGDEPPLPPPAPGPVDFARDIAPIFEARCRVCHGPEKQRGGLRLDSIEAARKGGNSGAVIEPGASADSLLILHVAGSEDFARMPPKGDPLTAEQIGILRAWIDREAPHSPAPADSQAAKGTDSWSLRPLSKPPIPEVSAEYRARVRNPVDAFVLEKLLAQGLTQAPEADRRVLIRRLSIDLAGLPPTPEEIDAFLADRASDAYERLVDRLLASPRYGERWARHWLDVAHYADSHGQDQDRPRPNAWPYRDYVIRSLNADKPYARFVREQVAGDALFPGDADALIATGFLAAGPFDESSLVSIREDSIDRLIGQYLDRDDVVTSTMSTFAGMTVGCARCHDHKFDPISQEDYYALQAVFAGVDKAERAYDADPTLARRRAELTGLLDRVKAAAGKPEVEGLTPAHRAAATAFATAHRASEGRWSTPEPIAWASSQGSVLKALIDRSILALGKRPERDTYTITLATEQTGLTGFRLGIFPDETLPAQGPGRADNGNLHLSEIRIKAHPKGKPEAAVAVKLASASADFDQEGWGIPRALDGDPATAWGIFPAVGRAHRAVFSFAEPVGFPEGTVLVVELDQSHGGGHLIGRLRLDLTAGTPVPAADSPLDPPLAALMAIPAADWTPARETELARLLWQADLERELALLPPPSKVFCATNEYVPDGTFRPAPKPRPVHVLGRGEVSRPGKPATPGAVLAVASLPGRFDLPDLDREGPRRAALADWLADPANPITWRVIINRAWHYHFGRGIVDTPNDLGRMGGAPSHPELLDWLAAEFRDSGGSLKSLHRLLVTSATYRQASRHDPSNAAKDADNRLLWRMNRGRLDAESVRDAILLASGRLDETMYGPPVQHFLIKPGIHITPEPDYEQFDVDKPEARRRSIYRYTFRTRPDPLLEALDCPDASQSAPARTSSLSPLQALALWNNKFTLKHAEHLANLGASASADLDGQLLAVSRRVLGRPPTDDERTAWGEYARKHGLANLCRVLFNSSEFLFID